MKRLLFSLLCGAVIYFGYLIFLQVIPLIFEFDAQTFAKLLVPLKIPDYILFNFFGLERITHFDTRGIIFVLIYMAINLFISSIPFYLAFTLYSRRNQKPVIDKNRKSTNTPNF
jgi:hypothetical protein